MTEDTKKPKKTRRPIPTVAPRERMDLDNVRGHLVRVPTEDGEVWINAFLVVRVTGNSEFCVIAMVGLELPTIARLNPDVVSARLMQARVSVSNPVGVISSIVNALGAAALSGVLGRPAQARTGSKGPNDG